MRIGFGFRSLALCVDRQPEYSRAPNIGPLGHRFDWNSCAIRLDHRDCSRIGRPGNFLDECHRLRSQIYRDFERGGMGLGVARLAGVITYFPPVVKVGEAAIIGELRIEWRRLCHPWLSMDTIPQSVPLTYRQPSCRGSPTPLRGYR